MHSIPMLDIWLTDFSQLKNIEVSQLAILLPEAERARSCRFRNLEAMRTFILSRIVLRTLLGKKVGVSAAAVPINLDENGKPHLLAPYSRWQFSLAHSGTWMACVVSPDTAVGIDIEAILNFPELATVISHLLPIDALSRPRDDASALLNMYRYWTVAEAYSKCTGVGLSRLKPQQFMLPEDITTAPLESYLYVDEQRWPLIWPDCPKGYVGAVISEKSVTTIRQRTWCLDHDALGHVIAEWEKSDRPHESNIA